MSDRSTSRDGLEAEILGKSIDQRQFDQGVFPFDAWEYQDPHTVANPDLIVQEPYEFKVERSVEVGADDAVYFGDKTTNDSWRITRSGDDLLVQQREAGSWVTKSTIAGA